MAADYQPLIDDLLDAGMIETVFSKDHKDLMALGVVEPFTGGSTVNKQIRVSEDVTAENYDRNDVNPDGGDFLSVQGTWNKIYTHVGFEVEGLDQVESTADSNKSIRNLITDQANLATRALSRKLFANFMTQIKSDIDATGAYSDASLSRSTYPTLASYEEATDETITLAYLRTARNNRFLNRDVGPVGGYTWWMEQAVFDAFNPLAAALHTWNTEGVADKKYDAGYQQVGNWEGINVVTTPGMTTGDVFLLRNQDLRFRPTQDFHIEQVPSGKHSAKFVMRDGWHVRVDNPGFQAKLTNKD